MPAASPSTRWRRAGCRTPLEQSRHLASGELRWIEAPFGHRALHTGSEPRMRGLDHDEGAHVRSTQHVNEEAGTAARRACIANLTAMLDEQMGDYRPLLSRKERKQRLLDLYRIAVLREPQTIAQPRHVRVDDDAIVASKGVAEDHVRR